LVELLLEGGGVGEKAVVGVGDYLLDVGFGIMLYLFIHKLEMAFYLIHYTQSLTVNHSTSHHHLKRFIIPLKNLIRRPYPLPLPLIPLPYLLHCFPHPPRHLLNLLPIL
jgi:hypothetical protein